MTKGPGREGEILTIDDAATRAAGQGARGVADHGDIGSTPTSARARPTRAPRSNLRSSSYPYWFMAPAAAIFTVFFLVPTIIAFYYSLTRWTLFDSEYIGLDNFRQFIDEPSLIGALRNTIVFAVITSGSKVVLGMAFAVLLTAPIVGRGVMRSIVFFPVLVSTIGVGLTFKALMDPFDGAINGALAVIGIDGPGWLTDPSYALISVAIVDVWRGVGLATVIYIAGILSIPTEYFEAARVDGATAWQRFRYITLPMAKPATVTVIILSFIGGLRSFDLIWAMTRGGPGFTSDVMASVIYKQYQAGFYGLSTAGNVMLFILVSCLVMPLFWFLNRRDPRG